MSQYYGQVEIKYQEDEARYMRRRISETRAEFFSAKARMAVFGNREVNIFLAGVERRGGFTGNDVIARQLTTQAIQSLREQFGFKRKDVPYKRSRDCSIRPYTGGARRFTCRWTAGVVGAHRAIESDLTSEALIHESCTRINCLCRRAHRARIRLPTCSQNRTPKRREARPSSGAGLLTFLLTCCFFGASDGIRTHDTQDHNRGYGRSEDLIVGVSPAY